MKKIPKKKTEHKILFHVLFIADMLLMTGMVKHGSDTKDQKQIQPPSSSP